jgi:orotate phosphoribosyltransferase
MSLTSPAFAPHGGGSMQSEMALKMFKESGALLEGHFLLTSGLHSNRYFQCAKVLQYPKYCELLCGDIARQFLEMQIDVVIAPALGGIVVAQEVGRQLNARTMFTERKDGEMQLRRGFEINPGERVLVCEDVVTTGGSVNEVIEVVKARKGHVAGVGCIVDRSGGTVHFALMGGGVQYPVLTMDVVTFKPEECPLCGAALALVKPGSRGNS